jgi:hypothetical protein
MGLSALRTSSMRVLSREASSVSPYMYAMDSAASRVARVSDISTDVPPVICHRTDMSINVKEHVAPAHHLLTPLVDAPMEVAMNTGALVVMGLVPNGREIACAEA